MYGYKKKKLRIVLRVPYKVRKKLKSVMAKPVILPAGKSTWADISFNRQERVKHMTF